MAVENIVISFDGDVSNLQPAIELLTKMGLLDAELAQQFNATNQAFKERQATIESTKQSADNLKGSIDALNTSSQEVSKNIVAAGTTEVFNKMATDVDNANTKTVSFRAQLRALREEMNQLESTGQANTQQFKDLAVEAGKVELQIQRTNERVAVLASPTKNIQALVEGTRAIAAGFGLAEGAAGLFGEKNEELEKTMLKVQSIMLIINSLQEISNLLLTESTIKVVTYEDVLAAAKYVQQAFAEGAAAAWAIATAGLAVLVVGVIALTSALSDNSEELERNKKLQEDLDAQRAADTKNTAAFAEEGLQKEIDVNKAKGESALQLYNLQLQLADKKVADATEAMEDAKKLDQAQFDAANLALQKAQDARVVLTNQHDTEVKEQQLKDLKDLAEARLDSVQKGGQAEVNAQIQVLTTERNLELNNAALTADERILIEQKYIADVKQLRLNAKIKQFQDEKSLDDSYASNTPDGSEQQLEAKKAALDQTYQADILAAQDNATKKKTIDENYIADLKKLNNDFITNDIKQSQDLDLANLDLIHSKNLISERDYQKDVYDLKVSGIDAQMALYDEDSNQYKALLKEKTDLEAANNKEVAALDLQDIKTAHDAQELELVEQYNTHLLTKQQFDVAILKNDIAADEKELQQANLTAEQKLAIERDLVNKKKALADIDVANKKKAEDLEVQSAKKVGDDILQIVSNTFQAQADAEIQAAKDSETAQEAANQRLLDAKLESQNEFNAQQASLQKQEAEAEKNIKRKQAQEDKALTIFKIVIDTAEAVIKALTLGPILGPPAAIAVGAAGAAEIAVVESKPIPLAKGTEKVTGGRRGEDSILSLLMPGERVVAEHINSQLEGIRNEDLPELAMIHKMLQNIPAHQDYGAFQIEAGHKGYQINYKLLAKEIGSEISKHPKAIVNLDKKGFNYSIQEGFTKTTYQNNRFSA